MRRHIPTLARARLGAPTLEVTNGRLINTQAPCYVGLRQMGRFSCLAQRYHQRVKVAPFGRSMDCGYDRPRVAMQRRPGFFESEMTGPYKPGYVETQKERILLGREGDPANWPPRSSSSPPTPPATSSARP